MDTHPLLNPDRVYPMTMSLDHAVASIVRAIIKRRRLCIVDWRWNLAVRLESPPRPHPGAHSGQCLRSRHSCPEKTDASVEKSLSQPEPPAEVKDPIDKSVTA